MSGYNEQVQKELEYLQKDVHSHAELRKRQQACAYQLKSEIRAKEKEIDDQCLRIQVLEKEDKQLIDRNRLMNEVLEQKQLQTDKVNYKQDCVAKEI